MHIGLPSESRIPEIGIALRIGTGRTADYFPMILGDKQPCVVTIHHLSEEDVVRNVTFGFQDIVAAQQS